MESTIDAIFIRDNTQPPYSLIQGQLQSPPDPEHGQLLIRVQAASVAHADLPGLLTPLSEHIQLPFVAGREAAGTVLKVGHGVSNFCKGDRVAFLIHYGAWAQIVRVDANLAIKLPQYLPFGEAATLLGAVVVAFDAVQFAGLSQNEYVVVTGAASAVGSAIVQLAKHIAKVRVVAVVSGIQEAQIAHKLAPDIVIDREITNVRTALEGGVVRIAFDTAGVAHRLRHIVAKGGRIIQAGEYMPEARAHGERRRIQLNDFCRQRKVTTTQVPLQPTPARISEAARVIAKYEIRVPHGPLFGIKEYVRGLVAAEEGVPSGKVVFLF